MVNCYYNSLRSFSSDRSYTLNRSSYARDSMMIEELLVPSKEQVRVLPQTFFRWEAFICYDWVTFFVAWQELYFCEFDFAFVSLPILPVKEKVRDFPGGAVVETPHFHCKGAQVQSLVGEPGSHMPQCVAKKKKKKISLTVNRNMPLFCRSVSQIPQRGI